MTILLTVLFTLLAIVAIAGVTIYFLAPLRISFKTNQRTEYDIEFGRYMKNVWISRDWFSITKVFYDKKFNVEYAHILISLFPASQKQLDKINAQFKQEQIEKEQEEHVEWIISQLEEIEDYEESL